jgi:hypothetical protein
LRRLRCRRVVTSWAGWPGGVAADSFVRCVSISSRLAIDRGIVLAETGERERPLARSPSVMVPIRKSAARSTHVRRQRHAAVLQCRHSASPTASCVITSTTLPSSVRRECLGGTHRLLVARRECAQRVLRGC